MSDDSEGTGRYWGIAGGNCWAAVTEFKLSYHEMGIVNKMVSLIIGT